MESTKFQALISLLDDNDPEVATQVERELIGLGMHGITLLEQAWEQHQDPTIQQRIEDLINRMQVSHFTEELLAWRKGGGKDLLHGWMTLTQVQYPTLNVQKYYNEVRKMTHKIWLTLNNGMNDLEKLCAINKQLYSVEGFSGNFMDPHKPDNNFLSIVLDTKKGNSLSVSALYAILSGELDIPLQIVNFHGYYALRYYSKDTHFYIDAYNKGIFFTPDQVAQFLRKLKVEDDVRTYKPLSNIYVILDIIRVLIETYRQNDEEERAVRFEQLLKDIEISFPDGPVLGGEDGLL